MPVWRGMLGDDDPQLRRLAARCLSEQAWFNPGCGDFVVDELLEMLWDEDPRIQASLVGMLPALLSPECELRALAAVAPPLIEGCAPALAAAAVAKVAGIPQAGDESEPEPTS